jgi:alpha-glucosidase
MRFSVWILALALCLLPALAQANPVLSPDGRIAVDFGVDGEGVPFYTVARDGEPLIMRSQLGFNFTDAPPMRRGFALESETRASHDGQWEQPWGERRFIRDTHNELAVTFVQAQPTARRLTVRVRVFDGGIGFRYEFPEQASLPVANIAEELTEFALSRDGEAWWVQAGDSNRYEYLYQRTAVSAVSAAHTPITMRLADGTHLSFHEAALVDYSGMWLRRIEGLRFRSELSPSSQGAKVTRHGAFTTPWRTILMADGPAGLFRNDLQLNLNAPNVLGDVSWFKPQKYIGVWWEMHLEKTSWGSGAKHGATTANTLRHIDFAAKHGFAGVLVEGWNQGWDGNWFANGKDFSFTQSYPDFDIKAITDHARRKGVRLIGHHETAGNIANYEPQLEAAMALYAKLGVSLVKTGYVADAGGIAAPAPSGNGTVMEWHDGQRMAQHHLKVVQVAAKHRIAVNAHEPIKDTGLRRTYPNWVAREAARGVEYDAWGEPKNPPDHVPEMVFTRMLAGPMDFTPGIFSLEGRGATPIPSTLARQLAYYVVVYSPVQMVADLPENLAQYPQELGFTAKVPADWAESLLVDGAVGEYAVIARKDRNSQSWYVGGVTDAQPRTATFTLDFLDAGQAYTATIHRDGEGADGLGAQDAKHRIVHETVRVKKGDSLSLMMACAGGFAVSIEPVAR